MRLEKLAVLSLLLAGTRALAQSSTVPAQPAEPVPVPTPAWPDLHNQNRAIAFASVLLGGGHVDAWKEVRAYGWCGDSASAQPVPGQDIPDSRPSGSGDAATPARGGGSSSADAPSTGGGSDDNGNSTTTTDCGWSVMYTTNYQLVECPDGRAFIARSGEGVFLYSRHEGDIVDWTEGFACAPGPFLTGADGMNRDRPLDIQHLHVTKR